MPEPFKWSPNDLSAQMAVLLDEGWDVIAYWFERWSAHKDGFILAGPGSEAQARARESFRRLHAEGSTPSMHYRVSLADDTPGVDDEICRVSRDGITVIAADFTGLAARCVRMRASTQADIVEEEREKCEEIIDTLVQRRNAFRATN
jgi:hypothetical protein